MDKKDKLLLYELQFNFPLNEKPYREIAKKLDMTENEVIERIKILKRKKIIRYIGPVLDFKKLGFESTFLAMSVPKKKISQVRRIINSFDNVSHNYLREDEKYNLWFTVTAPGGQLSKQVKLIRELTGINDVLNLKSEETLKIDTRFKI